jgi:hypothetical protein
MGHIQKMTDKQRMNWYSECYKRKKDANKGSNYVYFNQEKWNKLEANGYEMYLFKDVWKNNTEATSSELEAKDVVEKLRKKGNYARIICGYIQTKQHVKHYTVIYKSKCKEKI